MRLPAWTVPPWDGRADVPPWMRRATYAQVAYHPARNAAALDDMVRGQGRLGPRSVLMSARTMYGTRRAVSEVVAAATALTEPVRFLQRLERMSRPAGAAAPAVPQERVLPIVGNVLEDKLERRRRRVRFYGVPVDPQLKLSYVRELRRKLAQEWA